MVVDSQVQQARALHELTRELDVLAARRRIPARVVVQQDDRHGGLQQSWPEDLTRVHETCGQRALRDDQIFQEAVLGIEQGYAEDLALQVLHERPERGVDLGRT